MRCCRWKCCWDRRVTMRREDVLELLRQLEARKTTPEDVAERLASLPFEDLGFAKVDHHRSLRLGMPEVIYAAGKTPAQVAAIFEKMVASGVSVLATRATEEQFAAVSEVAPGAVWNGVARCISLASGERAMGRGRVAV